MSVRPHFPAAPAGGAKVRWALSILHPGCAGGLDSDRIALFQPDGTMDYYAKATYPDRLPPIVQHALLDGFEASGRIDAVAREEAALHADYNLVIEVKDFAAHYSQPDGVPSVTVSITAKLTTAHGRVIVGSFSTVQTGIGLGQQRRRRGAGAAAGAGRGGERDRGLGADLPRCRSASRRPSTASPGKPAEQLLHDATRGSEKLRDVPWPQ